MKKLLVVVDMQNDFITGSLGTQQAVSILPNVLNKIKEYTQNDEMVVFTKDTHTQDYLSTQEGKNLPVIHCLEHSKGWELVDDLLPFGHIVFEKPAFASLDLVKWITQERFDSIELIGLCTDICVISNAMVIKAALPEAAITIDASCCAGVTVESHNNALAAMKICQFQITNYK